MADRKVEVKTHFSNCWWPRCNMGKDAMKRGLMAMREQIVSTGASLTHDMPEPPPCRPWWAAVKHSSDEESDTSDEKSDSSASDDGVSSSDEKDGSSASGDDVHAGPRGWPLVDRLGWRLRGDGVLDEAAVRRALDDLGDGGRAALTAFLNAREAELADDPYLATKSRALRLQFAALGQDWFATLQGSPALADYLENEAQTIDLEAILG